jgi:integrase
VFATVINPVNGGFVLPRLYPEQEIGDMRKPKTRLTALGVARFQAPSAGRREIFDAALPGFGLRVSATDARSYFVMAMAGSGPVVRNDDGEIIAGRRLRRFTVGDAKVLSLDVARDKARDLLRRIDAGEDPGQPRAVMSTFREFADGYMARCRAAIRPSTYAARVRMLGVMRRWDHLPLDAIRTQDVVALLDDAIARGAPVYANRLLSLTKVLFGDALRRGVLDANPAALVRKPTKERSRERSLTDAEIGWLWRATGAMGWPWGDFFRVLLLTGQRRGQAETMTWPDVDLERRLWVCPAATMKGGRAHEVAISDLLAEVLEHARDTARRLGVLDERGLVFHVEGRPLAGFSQARRRLDAGMAEVAGEAVKPWTIHDLRRTLVHNLAAMNIPPHICDKILAHSSGVISGVSAVYNKFEYQLERKNALAAWGRRVAEIIGRGQENVRQLHG